MRPSPACCRWSEYLIPSCACSIFWICLLEWRGFCRGSAEQRFIHLCNQSSLLRGSVCFPWRFASVTLCSARGLAVLQCRSCLPIWPCPCALHLVHLSIVSLEIFAFFLMIRRFYWVTADASACSAISAAPLALFTLIRPTLELFEAEDLMSPLIRKWHPLWIRLAAWKVKNCQWLQK